MTTIAIRDVSLFVEVIGQGYPVLLMHGGPGLDHSTLAPLRPCADQFTLIFYDHRCNGRSLCADLSSMTWDNLIADADALRQKLDFAKWAVLGHSFGGMVALEYALRFPDSLSHLMLMDTCGDSFWVQVNAPKILAKRGYRPKAVQAAHRFFSGQLPPEEVFRSALQFARAYYYRINYLTLARQVFSGAKVKMRPEAHVFGFSQLLPGWTVMDRLGEIEVPTLVLAGRHDFQFPPEHQAELAAGLPNGQLELIERAGHNAPMERSAEVIQVIRDFMEAHPGLA